MRISQVVYIVISSFQNQAFAFLLGVSIRKNVIQSLDPNVDPFLSLSFDAIVQLSCQVIPKTISRWQIVNTAKTQERTQFYNSLRVIIAVTSIILLIKIRLFSAIRIIRRSNRCHHEKKNAPQTQGIKEPGIEKPRWQEDDEKEASLRAEEKGNLCVNKKLPKEASHEKQPNISDQERAHPNKGTISLYL